MFGFVSAAFGFIKAIGSAVSQWLDMVKVKAIKQDGANEQSLKSIQQEDARITDARIAADGVQRDVKPVHTDKNNRLSGTRPPRGEA